jgi:hypothetical protein
MPDPISGRHLTGDNPRSDGEALVIRGEQITALAGVPLSDRRIQLPSSAPLPAVRDLESVVREVNNGAGLWARAGGRIGNSEVRALRVRRGPTEDEVLHGADPEVLLERKGYEALAMLFEHSSLDVQTEIYRRLSRRRPWWAWLDVFGWFRGARAPVERFEEIYEPGGEVELFVMGHDRGSWLFPRLFKRHFGFTVGARNWMLSRREVTKRGGDVEASEITERGYARALIRQFEDMAPAQRWRALTALEPDLLDTPISDELAEIDPSWFDPNRFGVAVLYDSRDPERGERIRDQAARVREFLTEQLRINPYLVEHGFDLSFVPISRRFPEVPSEPIHQFVVDLREHIPASKEVRFDLIRFADFIDGHYPRWPQLTPEQLHQVRGAKDYKRFIDKTVDLWGMVEDVTTHRYTTSKTLSWSTRESAGTDSKGRPKFRTRTSVWTVDVPAVRVTVSVRGEESRTIRGIYNREGNAHATGHYSHSTVNPDLPVFQGGREFLRGNLDASMTLVF